MRCADYMLQRGEAHAAEDVEAYTHVTYPAPARDAEPQATQPTPRKGHDGLAWPKTMDGQVWAEEFSNRFPSVPVDDALGWFANAIMRGYDTANQRRDADGMVEEGLGVPAPNSDATSSTSPAPTPTPQPAPASPASGDADGRVWVLHVWPDRGPVAHNFAPGDTACDAGETVECIPVVPCAELERVRRERDAARDLAHAEMSRADGLQAACNAMAPADMLADLQHQRDQFEKAYHDAERHNESLRATVETHGDTIRTLRAQLAAATGRLEKLTDPAQTMFCTKESLVREVESILRALGRTVEGDA